MEPGWVYVLVNSSMPGLAKVGRTSRPPAERVAELSSATGVATPFILAFDQPVADCVEAERAVHAELDRRGLRAAPNREFFRGSPSEIVRVVLDVAGGIGVPDAGTGSPARARPAEALVEAGDRCLAGLGKTLQDTGEAIRLYKLAATRGAVPACARLGRIYVELYVARPSRAARRRAMAPLKQGIRRGDLTCYAEMALLFAAERHLGNFAKAWALFFEGQGTAADDRMAAFCCRYVDSCLALGLEPVRHAALHVSGQAVVARLLAELERVRDTQAEFRVARALRWAYLHRPVTGSALQPPAASRLEDARAGCCPGQEPVAA